MSQPKNFCKQKSRHDQEFQAEGVKKNPDKNKPQNQEKRHSGLTQGTKEPIHQLQGQMERIDLLKTRFVVTQNTYILSYQIS